ncbi:hypothetical protein PoB_001099600 [Plakobranchus ocellatus]|uniref:Uncharacterized protein n=1 Tax=Plakobranchus ocellatus TaxID=259542 RepID=A0AAV3YQ15_9GAST|nr:hypothetical protein PoB_001099600 [Plakobranchus ocellatus]
MGSCRRPWRSRSTIMTKSHDLLPGFPVDFHDDGVPVKDEEFLGNFHGRHNEDLPGTSWKREWIYKYSCVYKSLLKMFQDTGSRNHDLPGTTMGS